MIIDSHAHLKHGDAQKTEYSAEAIVEVMDAVGIEKSVVFAMSTTTRRSIEMAQRAVEQFPDRLIPYAYALPNYERSVLEELGEAISQRGFRGIKLHVGECTLSDYVVDPVLRLAGEYGVPCLIDCAGRLGDIERMSNTFPETRIIIAHLGRYLCQDETVIDRFIALAKRRPNLFLDVSGVVMLHKIEDAARQVGVERILWGTDGPHNQPDTVTFARTELDKVRELDLNPTDKAGILGGSIATLLGV